MSLLFIKNTFFDAQAVLQLKQAFNRSNCSVRSIDEYPDWFTDKEARYDFVAMHSFAVVYLFLAIAVVCDEYCVPAVEKLSYKFHLSFDVAGATLLALSSSSPEFFINFYATFLTEGDMGVGTIVGSSVFNTLAITACCCLLTGVNFAIDWWPISRDLLWYSASVAVLTLCLWDNYVRWWEALILVVLYVLNVTNLLLDKKLQAKVRDKNRPCKLKCFIPLGEVLDFTEMLDPENDDEPFNFLHWPKDSIWNKFIWLLSYPLECVFSATIPNLRRNCSRNCVYLCLIMSILWISILTYLCSWSITLIGYYLAIPDSVMGLVLMAFGTSIPEAISSIIVTKKGYGSMAVCNAIGSNTVDILVCLGVPWLVKAVFFPAVPNKNAVFIISDGLVYTSACLLLSAALLYSAFMASRFQLGLMVGILCLIMYIVFIVLAVSFEMIIFDKTLPVCTKKLFRYEKYFQT